MQRRFFPAILTFAFLYAASTAHAQDCENATSSEQVAQCLGVELRQADAKINTLYRQVMDKMGDAERKDLRQRQRQWIKDRDTACQLDTKEKDRERWYQVLLKDYAKTVCVTRYTNRRTGELEKTLAYYTRPQDERAQAAPPVAPVYARAMDTAYDAIPPTPHSTGKWYFELGVDPGQLVTVGPCAITFGVLDKNQFTGKLLKVSAKHANESPVRFGIAIDLDNGKLYFSLNGDWLGGAPGSSGGLDLKLGRDYVSLYTTSAEDITPYLTAKALIPNFGERPMAYAMPAGYRPWKPALN